MYPALAVLQALEGKVNEILWVGGQGGMESDLVQRLNIPFQSIPAAGMHGIGLSRMPANLWKLAKGVFASRKIIQQFRPDAILYTGGFVAAPMAVAARRIPSLLFVPDIEPGLALKFIYRLASLITVITEDSNRYFSGAKKTIITGYPIRKTLTRVPAPQARAHFNLNDQMPVILIFGGSKGARSINRAVLNIVDQILPNIQILHITGKLDWDEVQGARTQLPSSLQSNYHIFPYLHEEMGLAYSAADLVVSRAGASTLGEYPYFSLPAILVPYPHAWRYQIVNAEFLAKKGAAIIIQDQDLNQLLLNQILSLLNEPQKLHQLSSAMARLQTPFASEKIADLLMQMADAKLTERGSA